MQVSAAFDTVEWFLHLEFEFEIDSYYQNQLFICQKSYIISISFHNLCHWSRRSHIITFLIDGTKPLVSGQVRLSFQALLTFAAPALLSFFAF